MSFIEAKNVIKQYANHRALDDVSINVPQGKIFGLLGPNGAGKTTLIRIINNITAPDSGEVLFNGHPLNSADVSRIGYLPEERGLYKKMKVGEQALYLARLKGLSTTEAKHRLTVWFEKFDIMQWWNKKLEELSKGMQQKVQFIATIIHDPDLLIFDEPFSGFDPVNAALLKAEILALKNAGRTIIFSTHNMASVEEICDEIALINKSQVVLSGNVNEVRNRFKDNTFRVSITNGSFTALPDVYSVISEETEHNMLNIRIRKEKEISNSELISALTQQHEIFSFTEELPSMNEVFLKQVSNV